MRKRSILIASIAVLIGASLFTVHSMRAAQPTAANSSPNASTNADSKTGEAQDIINLSSPLREILYEPLCFRSLRRRTSLDRRSIHLSIRSRTSMRQH